MTYTLDRSAPRHQSERLHDNTAHKVPFLDHVNRTGGKMEWPALKGKMPKQWGAPQSKLAEQILFLFLYS